MEKFKFLKKKSVSKLPKATGIYSFKKGRQFLYIGKANNIRERVKNHFKKETFKNSLFINESSKIGYIKTDSEIEALILEANLIKKKKPKYNIVWRDDKNFFFVGITNEELPRVFTTHQPTKALSSKYQTSNKKKKKLNTKYIGPFVEGSSLKKTLKVLRKIFPYYAVKKHSNLPCSWCHLGLCPGPHPDKKKYLKDVKNLISVLKGKRSSVLKNLKKEMYSASETKDYEKAGEIRDQLRALEKILSHAKIFEKDKVIKDNWGKTEKELKEILKTKSKISRIEAYDVSNIQGQKATGSMVTFIKGKPDKNLYRRFKIKISQKPNDVAMIKEILERRLKHLEWCLPELILIDGGIAQLNAAVRIKNRESRIKNIKVMAIAKKKNELYIENKKRPILLKKLPREIFNLILQLRDEAHRFAIIHHRKIRKKDLFL